jgi:hypothetical protein
MALCWHLLPLCHLLPPAYPTGFGQPNQKRASNNLQPSTTTTTTSQLFFLMRRDRESKLYKLTPLLQLHKSHGKASLLALLVSFLSSAPPSACLATTPATFATSSRPGLSSQLINQPLNPDLHFFLRPSVSLSPRYPCHRLLPPHPLCRSKLCPGHILTSSFPGKAAPL